MNRTNGTVAVLIPSRNRPGQLEEAIRSVRDTSEAHVLVYIDDDQHELYAELRNEEANRSHGRTGFTEGPRVDTVAALNTLVERFPDYSAYGVLTDNSVMKTAHWDSWLLETLDCFPGRLGVLSPFHNCGPYVDQPFVSREWIDVVGWYACPEFKHYAWPLVTGVIGGQTAIIHCREDQFAVFHDYVGGYWEAVYAEDCKALYHCLATTVLEKVDLLQRAMRNGRAECRLERC